MYTIYFKDRGEEKFHSLSEPVVESWIHAEYASFDDIEKIANILRIDPEDIADALDMNEIARIERIEKEAFVVFVRFPHIQEAGLYTATLTIVFAKEHLVTICPTQCHIIQKMLAEPSDLATKMKAKILIHILLKIVHEYNKVIKKTRAEVINQEKDISTMTDAEITELTRKEEKLNQCHNSLQPLKEVIEKILSGKYTTLYERDQDLLEDLLLATEQAEEMCRLSLRILSSLRDSVQVIITNQFNKTIRLLTALTIVLNLPTTISSIFGMNIPLPFEHSRLAFPFIMCSILLVSLAAIFLFQRRRWL